MQGLEGELETLRRLAELHRGTAEERQRKVAELEGIVQEFRQHIQVCPPRLLVAALAPTGARGTAWSQVA